MLEWEHLIAEARIILEQVPDIRENYGDASPRTLNNVIEALDLAIHALRSQVPVNEEVQAFFKKYHEVW